MASILIPFLAIFGSLDVYFFFFSNSSANLKQHIDKVKYSTLFDKYVLTYSHGNNMYCDLSITWLIIIHVSTCTYRDVNLEWFRLIIFIWQPKKNLSFKYWFYFGHLPLFNIQKLLKLSLWRRLHEFKFNYIIKCVQIKSRSPLKSKYK